MARQAKTLPSHLRPIVKTKQFSFLIPESLYQRLTSLEERCKENELEFDLNEILIKATEKAIRQTEEYFDSQSKNQQETDEYQNPSLQSVPG